MAASISGHRQANTTHLLEGTTRTLSFKKRPQELVQVPISKQTQVSGALRLNSMGQGRRSAWGAGGCHLNNGTASPGS